jgi:hypothetical protein
VTGYPHGNDDGKIPMSAESMSAKVLCQSHNSKLSNVDIEGSRFVLVGNNARGHHSSSEPGTRL